MNAPGRVPSLILVEDKDKLRALVRLPAGEPEWLSLDDVCEVVADTRPCIT